MHILSVFTTSLLLVEIFLQVSIRRKILVLQTESAMNDTLARAGILF